MAAWTQTITLTEPAGLGPSASGTSDLATAARATLDAAARPEKSMRFQGVKILRSARDDLWRSASAPTGIFETTYGIVDRFSSSLS